MPKVSVIIPVYNAMRYFPETVDSLLNQTFQDFEVIAINDGSSDNIEEWFSSIQDARFQLISQVNQGQAKARNVGLEIAQGEYIAFLDADDLWEPTKLEKQVRVLDASPQVGVVYAWVSGIDSNGIPRGRTIKNFDEGNVWQALVLHNILECGSTPLIRRSCFDKVGFFDVRLPPCEDLDLWIRISRYFDFSVIHEPLVFYRLHEGSSGKNWKVAEKNYLIVLEKTFENPPPEFTTKQVSTLKAKAHAMAYLRFLAWSALQSKAKDYKTAIAFSQIARQYYLPIIFTKYYMRLLIAIWIIQYLKPKNYDRFVSFVYGVRRSLGRS